jgi:hypothetical protein
LFDGDMQGAERVVEEDGKFEVGPVVFGL